MNTSENQAFEKKMKNAIKANLYGSDLDER